MSDYEEGAPFSARLGTDPWNAPELTFGIEIKIDDLPQSDIYSFGLLLSRVFMNGGDPFEGMTMDEINELKRGIDGSNLLLYDKVRLAIFAKVEYSDSQQLLVQKILLVTTRQKPEHRFPIDLIGTELIILGAMVRE
jgi:serine/threonine protein kinase